MSERTMSALLARVGVVALFALPLSGCQCGKQPAPGGAGTATAAVSAAPAPTSSAEAAPAQPKQEREIAGASVIVVAWKGAEGAAATVTRTKADAKKLAEELLGKLRKDGASFEELARKSSDDETSRASDGALGNFEKNAMPEPISSTAFKLKVGDVSDAIEAPKGYYLIKRTR